MSAHLTGLLTQFVFLVFAPSCGLGLLVLAIHDVIRDRRNSQ